MKNVILSIVVPVYNVENYLERCIDSLLNQTLKSIEILLINDGSTDSSLKICEAYARSYQNIKVFSKENTGLGSTRNYGLLLSKGKYIAFVDSDDYVNKYMYEDMYKLIEKNNCDICECGYKKVYDEKQSPINDNTYISKIYENKYDIVKEYLLFHIEPYAWNKMYRKDFLIENDIRFQEYTLYEDVVTTLKALSLCKKIIITDKKYYYYYQRPDSIMHKIKQKNKKDYINQITQFYQYLYSNYNLDIIQFPIRVSKFRLTYNLLNILKELDEEDILREKFAKFQKDVVIFGASDCGVLLKHYFQKNNIKVRYFCDNSPQKWGEMLDDTAIIKPSQLLVNDNFNICIGSMYYEEIYLQLKKMNLEKYVLDIEVF